MRDSLAGFAQSIQIPGSAVGGDDSELFEPVGTGMALHHNVLCNAIQTCIETDYGRLIIMLPPGSAKSTYASSIAPAWAMGKWPGLQTILVSYGTELAKKHSRKARAICKQQVYLDAFAGHTISRATSAAEQWSLTSGSEYMAAGILAGVTGSRGDLIVGDDLIAGRQEADSPAVRMATNNAWMEDIMTRQKPRASVILLGTRWHPLDPIGALLPADYDGRSGPVLCSDGMVWQVLCIPAQCEREDDPCGRKIGEYLWPEVWGEEHFTPFRSNPRTWASLYQQRPAIDGGGRFKREWVKWYEIGEQPAMDELNIYGASDWGAPSETSEDPDFTEHGVVGTDDSIDFATGMPMPHLWFLDWWYGQETTDIGMTAFFRMIGEWRPKRWWNEKGPIYNAIQPTLADRMRRASRRTWLDTLPSSLNKIARAESFFDIAAQGRVHMPNVPWAHRLVDQLCSFPVVAHDDGVDVCTLLGRAVGSLAWKRPEPVEAHRDLKPFSQEWLFYNDRKPTSPGGRTR
jgi:predicted phage terminase large subunit-like protein